MVFKISRSKMFSNKQPPNGAITLKLGMRLHLYSFHMYVRGKALTIFGRRAGLS